MDIGGGSMLAHDLFPVVRDEKAPGLGDEPHRRSDCDLADGVAEDPLPPVEVRRHKVGISEAVPRPLEPAGDGDDAPGVDRSLRRDRGLLAGRRRSPQALVTHSGGFGGGFCAKAAMHVGAQGVDEFMLAYEVISTSPRVSVAAVIEEPYRVHLHQAACSGSRSSSGRRAVSLPRLIGPVRGRFERRSVAKRGNPGPL